jgi:hypothetical protein
MSLERYSIDFLELIEKLKKRNVKLKVQDLQKRLQTTIALLVDERSILSQEIVAFLEEAVAKTGHECGCTREDWGESQL